MGGQHWEVTGGGKAGGIVVRAGEDLQSAQLPDRLARGALVLEEQLVGERLCYKKVSGDGPDKGWVSLKLKGAPLLEKKEAPAPVKKGPAPPPELTREEALNLQKDLYAGFKEDSWQSELKALKAKHPEGGRQFNMDRSKLYNMVQHAVIVKYGFEASMKGVFLMGQVMTQWSQKDPEIGQIGFKINLLLDPPPAPNAPAGSDDFPPPGEFDAEWLPPLPEGQMEGWLNAYGMDGIANLRDMAGVDPARPRRVGGGKLKRGLLFRTASWTVANEADIDRLKNQLGIKTYFDLRQGTDAGFEGADGIVWDAYPPSPSGRHADQELPPAGSFRRLHFNFARGTGYRELSEEEQVNKIPRDDRKRQTNLWFQLELRKTFAEGFAAGLERHLAVLNACILYANDDIVLAAMKACTEPANFPVAFGCMTGKDRTGLMAMLVLSALGASKEEIMEDYLLTNLAAAHNSDVIGRNYHAWEMQKAAMVAAWHEEERRKQEEAAAASGEAAAEPRADQAAEGGAEAGAEAEAAPQPPAEPAAEASAEAEAEAAPQPGAEPAAEPSAEAEAESEEKPQDTGSIASNVDNLKAAKVFRVVMEYTLHVLERESGGALNYLNSIGFGPEDVAKLRELLVEPEEA